MATNKNALIRYRTLDKCLQNRQRKWTLDDLINSCSDALYEFEGKDSYVSKRTVQSDIQLMRSDKLGYNAPIVVYEKKYYTYEDPEYTITTIPITPIDMEILSESVEMLKQFKNFSLFSELNGVIQKLEDKVYREQHNQSAIIHMESNENLRGLNYLDNIYQAIIKKIVLKLEYKSFKSRTPSIFCFHPYILKEFNNRWFVVGQKEGGRNILNLALDRIKNLEVDQKTKYRMKGFDAEDYYKHTIGVTVMSDKDIIDVHFIIDRINAPYVMTKPLHASQELLETYPDRSQKYALRVHHNFELERRILSFGESIEILKPRRLRYRIKKKLELAVDQYKRQN